MGGGGVQSCALRLFGKPDDVDVATWRPPASSVWIVETTTRIDGPSVQFQNMYRLRHFATGAYLFTRRPNDTVAGSRKEKVELQVSLGGAVSSDAASGGGIVLESTSFDDKGCIALDTGCYLRSNNNMYMSMSHVHVHVNMSTCQHVVHVHVHVTCRCKCRCNMQACLVQRSHMNMNMNMTMDVRMNTHMRACGRGYGDSYGDI